MGILEKNLAILREAGKPGEKILRRLETMT
jgi:hypothetical protein